MSASYSVETRAVMIGHTVIILSAFDGLRGHYATVLSVKQGDRTYLVETTDKRRICYTAKELQVVPLGDTIRHGASDENLMCATSREIYGLVVRAVELRMLADSDYHYEQHQRSRAAPSRHCQAVCRRRADRIRNKIEAIKRARQSSLMAGKYVTALVPYATDESMMTPHTQP